MICQICGVFPATERIEGRFYGNGEKVAACASCAKTVKEFFAERERSAGKEGALLRLEEVCPSCKRAIALSLRTGKFGCPNCYRVFRDRIFPADFGKNASYRGRVPASVEKEERDARAKVLAEAMSRAFFEGDEERAYRIAQQLREDGKK